MNLTEEKAPPSGEIIATLRDVTVTYDGYLTRALSRVNAGFRRGEVTAVLGAKGAGKSSVLKILAGRLGATEGSVKVFGGSPRRGAKARIGYLPGKADPNRQPGFFARLFGAKNEGSTSVRGVGRLTPAFMGNRDLLILDDPFNGLEPVELAEAKTLIREIVARGKTVILSSDSLMEVKDICQRMVILHEGKIQGAGTLAELLSAGGAIRFLPTVLPSEIVERVLRVLREEILGESGREELTASEQKRNSGIAAAPVEKIAVTKVDQLLTSLSKPEGAKSAPSAAPKAEDPIDHGKLEELTKPKPPE